MLGLPNALYKYIQNLYIPRFRYLILWSLKISAFHHYSRFGFSVRYISINHKYQDGKYRGPPVSQVCIIFLKFVNAIFRNLFTRCSLDRCHFFIRRSCNLWNKGSSRNDNTHFSQFLTPLPIVTIFNTKALILSSQKSWPPPPETVSSFMDEL